MNLLVGIVVIGAFLGSPLWTSALVAILPRRLLALAIVVLGIQAWLAWAIWWFFWGGGIGGELHLAETWQLAIVFALAPFIVAASRLLRP